MKYVWEGSDIQAGVRAKTAAGADLLVCRIENNYHLVGIDTGRSSISHSYPVEIASALNLWKASPIKE